jgi:hypothetical protein
LWQVPTSDKPLKINVVVPPKLRSDLRRVADAQETTVSELTRDALRRIVRKELPSINRGAVLTRKDDE